MFTWFCSPPDRLRHGDGRGRRNLHTSGAASDLTLSKDHDSKARVLEDRLLLLLGGKMRAWQFWLWWPPSCRSRACASVEGRARRAVCGAQPLATLTVILEMLLPPLCGWRCRWWWCRPMRSFFLRLAGWPAGRTSPCEGIYSFFKLWPPGDKTTMQASIFRLLSPEMCIYLLISYFPWLYYSGKMSGSFIWTAERKHQRTVLSLGWRRIILCVMYCPLVHLHPSVYYLPCLLYCYL